MHYDTVQEEWNELIYLSSQEVGEYLRGRKAEIVELLYSLYSRAYDEGEQEGLAQGYDEGYEYGLEEGSA